VVEERRHPGLDVSKNGLVIVYQFSGADAIHHDVMLLPLHAQMDGSMNAVLFPFPPCVLWFKAHRLKSDQREHLHLGPGWCSVGVQLRPQWHKQVAVLPVGAPKSESRVQHSADQQQQARSGSAAVRGGGRRRRRKHRRGLLLAPGVLVTPPAPHPLFFVRNRGPRLGKNFEPGAPLVLLLAPKGAVGNGGPASSFAVVYRRLLLRC
jgi:hypothetical protein